MFKNSYQNGLLSIFYSCGANPLAIWDMNVKNGHIKRLTDNEVNSIVLEIVSTNVATTYIVCPKNNQVLGIKLPFLVMIIKNLKRYFSFEITILDDKNMRRRFRISNFQSTTKIKPFCTTMPIGLAHGWNQIQFNLADFTKRAYGTQFQEALRVQIHANARLRRIYFSERLYTEEELPQDYKLYLPLERKQKKGKDAKKTVETAAALGTQAPLGEEAPVAAPLAPKLSKKGLSKAELKSQPKIEDAGTATEGAAGEETGEAPTEGGTPAPESEAGPEGEAIPEADPEREAGEAPPAGEPADGGEGEGEGAPQADEPLAEETAAEPASEAAEPEAAEG